MGVVPDAQHLMTVTGPLSPADLGVTDAHDHLFLRTPETPGQELEDVDAAIAEVREAVGANLGTIVEMTPIGLGRRPAGLRAVAEATGVPVIGATGFHRDAHYPADHWVHDAPVEVLADRIIADLERGMHPRTGRIRPSRSTRRGPARSRAAPRTTTSRVRAAAARGDGHAAATGAAILVHTEIGTAGHDIVDLLPRTAWAPTASPSPTWTATPTGSSTPRSPRAA